jgi:hypothetical protein
MIKGFLTQKTTENFPPVCTIWGFLREDESINNFLNNEQLNGVSSI